MAKSFLNYPVDMPGILFLLITFILILTSVVVYKHNETMYLINTSVSRITRDDFMLGGRTDEETSKEIFKQQAKSNSPTNKTFANAMTMIFWGFIGAILYYLAFIFFMIFINPVGSDTKRSHYVHADKKYIVMKRLLWCAAIAFVTITLIGAWAIFTRIAAPYYQLSVYDFKILSFVMFVASVALITVMMSGVRLGCRVIIRTY